MPRRRDGFLRAANVIVFMKSPPESRGASKCDERVSGPLEAQETCAAVRAASRKNRREHRDHRTGPETRLDDVAFFNQASRQRLAVLQSEIGRVEQSIHCGGWFEDRFQHFLTGKLGSNRTKIRRQTGALGIGGESMTSAARCLLKDSLPRRKSRLFSNSSTSCSKSSITHSVTVLVEWFRSS